jgi:Na+-driven multidrug efflux pump
MDRALLKEILRLGLPAAVQSSLLGLSNLFIQRYINSFGAAALAGMGAAKRLDRFINMIAQCLGLSVSTFVSQNVGAKRLDRAFRGIRISVLICLAYAVVVGGLVLLFVHPLLGIFSRDEETIRYGANMLYVMVPFYFMMAMNQIYSNAVRGFGKSFVVMVCSVAGMIGCRQLYLIIAMNVHYSIWTLYAAFPVGWFFASASVILYYFLAIRRRYKRDPQFIETL